MAVYWPKHKVALDVVDDPYNMPVDEEAFPGYTVFPVRCHDICDPVAFGRMTRRIAHEMGEETPFSEADAVVARERVYHLAFGERTPARERAATWRPRLIASPRPRPTDPPRDNAA